MQKTPSGGEGGNPLRSAKYRASRASGETHPNVRGLTHTPMAQCPTGPQGSFFDPNFTYFFELIFGTIFNDFDVEFGRIFGPKLIFIVFIFMVFLAIIFEHVFESNFDVKFCWFCKK